MIDWLIDWLMLTQHTKFTFGEYVNVITVKTNKRIWSIDDDEEMIMYGRVMLKLLIWVCNSVLRGL